MIEVPRAALQAGVLAKEAEFFSFGTNDLTQMTLGISRDDAQVRPLDQSIALHAPPALTCPPYMPCKPPTHLLFPPAHKHTHTYT